MQRHHRWASECSSIDRNGIAQVDNVNPQASSEFWKLPVMPAVSAKRPSFHFRGVERSPRVERNVGGLHEVSLPWRDYEMQFSDLRLQQQAACHVERMAL